ncbi:MAG: ABC transporter permease [Firmicutes bacterium]|nr:ABC transporter permease [Bacillota bacterium]
MKTKIDACIDNFNLKQFMINNSAFVTLVFLLIIASLLQFVPGLQDSRFGLTNFFSVSNFVNILFNNAIVGIIALGMTLIIISGGIDLSVGAASAACGLAAIWVMNATGNIMLGVTAAIVMGIIMGAFNGILIAKFSIPAFIVTLGAMRIFRSLSQHFFRGGGILLDAEVRGFAAFSRTRIFDGTLPLPILYWLGLAIIVGLFAKHTALGRHIYAVGSNERAANLSAVNVKRVKIFVFMISGALVAFASLVEAARIGSMNSSSSGNFYELEAIAAVIIGGTAMSGGRGRIIGTVFGTLTLGVINNTMNLMGLPSFLVGTVQGSILILAVLLQRSFAEKEKQF